ncbi:MAG: hypothetical protein F4X77_15270 [Acidobacteriia bacterium]|nr:hypothetical protein [Terriglobia bacterium]
MPKPATCPHETWTVIKARRETGFRGLEGDQYGELQRCDQCGWIRQAYIDGTGWVEVSKWQPEAASP